MAILLYIMASCFGWKGDAVGGEVLWGGAVGRVRSKLVAHDKLLVTISSFTAHLLKRPSCVASRPPPASCPNKSSHIPNTALQWCATSPGRVHILATIPRAHYHSSAFVEYYTGACALEGGGCLGRKMLS